jgi:hypothetical protein
MGLILMSLLQKLRKVFKTLLSTTIFLTDPNMVPRKGHWHTLGEDFTGISS